MNCTGPIAGGAFLAAVLLVAAPSAHFTEQLLKGDFAYSFGVAAGDLDGDGDTDLTCADVHARVTGKLYWMENDGQGNFQQHAIEPGYPHGDRLERHAIGDVDGDGRPDVVIVENWHGDLIWYRNSGAPQTDDAWRRHIIARDAIPGAYDVALGDLDGDADLDAAVSTWLMGNQFVWFENPGAAGHDQPWTMRIIEHKLDDTRMVRLADLNNDGRLDLVGSARVAGQLLWYENPGEPRTGEWTRHVIDAALPNAMHGEVVDLDADDDLDIVLATGMLSPDGQVVWYENVGASGDAATWQRHTICDAVGKGFEAVVVDLDGDGHLDVAATAFGPQGQVAWFQNPGDPRGAWATHVLKSGWSNPNQIISADLDGDGRPDLIACAEKGANEVRWWRNDGKEE